MARLRSDFWVAAFLRLKNASSVTAVLRRRGAAEAGAIYIKVDCLDGRARLFSPAPYGAAGGDDESLQRQFALMLESDPLTIEQRITREIGYDGDLWLIEIEDRSGELQLP